MYKQIDKIIQLAEKIAGDKMRGDFISNALDNLFGDKKYELAHFLVGGDANAYVQIYVCAVAWVNDENEPELYTSRMYIDTSRLKM